MKQRDLWFALVVVLVVALVIPAGERIGGAGAAQGVMVGAAIAAAFQLASFTALTRLLPGKQMLVFGAGMLGRFVLVAAVALVVLPLSGLPAASTLLTMATVLFVTSVAEPVFLTNEIGKTSP